MATPGDPNEFESVIPGLTWPWETPSAGAPPSGDLAASADAPPPPVTEPGELAPSAFGPQLDEPGAAPIPPPEMHPADAAAFGAPPAPPEMHPADAAALGVPPEPPPAPYMGAPPVAAFGPAPPSLAQSPEVGRVAVEPTALTPPNYSFTRPGDQGAPLPSIQSDAPRDPFANVTDAEGFAAARQLARTPGALDEIERNHETARQLKASADSVRAEDDNLRQLKENQEDERRAHAETQKKADQVTADAIALSKRPLDRHRWFSNLNVFQKIAAVVAAVTGGLISKPGGPNLGLDYVTKSIDDDINDQKAQIESERGALTTRQNAVAQEFARTGDLYRSAETVRLATYNAVINKLKTEQQNYDPRGTGFIEHGKAIAGMEAKAAQAHENMRKTMFGERLEVLKSDREDARLAEDLRKNRANEQLERQKEARAAAAARADKTVYDSATLAARNPGLPVPPPGVAMSEAEYTKWLARQKTGEELKGVARSNDPETLARATQVPGVKTQSGKPIQFLPDEIKDIKKSKYIATELVRKSDELRALVKDHGFDTGWSKSDYYQRAQQLYNDILLMDKDLKALGALSASDIKLEQANLGTENPTQLRSTMVGMESYRRSVVEGINTKVATHAVLPDGEVPARWEPTDTSKLPKAKETPEQARLQTLLQKSEQSYDEAVTEEIRKQQADLSPNQLRDREIYNKTVAAGLDAADAKFKSGMSLKQQAAIETLRIEANGPVGDPVADRAREDLTKVVDSAETTALRQLAQAALYQASNDAVNAAGSPPVEAPVREVVHETVPPPPVRRKK